MRLSPTLLAAGLSFLLALPGGAATLYVAPKGAVAAKAVADGSRARPWKSPAAALAKAKPGDTIVLLDGDHGTLAIKDRKFARAVTIQAENPRKAHLERIAITGTSGNMVFRNLSVWPSNPAKAGATRVDAGFATNVTFDGLDVRSASTAAGYAGWTKAQWEGHALKGFQARGAGVTLKNSTFTGLGFGVVMLGNGATVAGNAVRGFSMDGIRVLGNNSTVRGNLITDAVRINKNHPDAIQSWAQNGKPVKGLVIADNTIVEWSSAKKSPYRAQLQGIGLFDGWYENLKITGNDVAVTAYHGIAVYGGRNVQITGNTVVNAKGNKVGYPWIGIFDKKKGPPSSNVTVSGNTAMKYLGLPDRANKVVSSGNGVIANPSATLKPILSAVASGTAVAVIKTAATPSQLLVPETAVMMAPQNAIGNATEAILARTAAPAFATAVALEQSGGQGAALSQAEAVAVPLPAGLWLMAGSLALLLGLRRNRTA
ncbi:right-handed parallel beta-helix repeat-containing protein [Tabrizicola sp. J26]|uniref:right-handed parallel beta-helix repeat-containing protein n=1 Tax=Alitabrizicola rongguiensis TaxID=2909234 RepID=UPI001F3AC361|nr:right-handed parallel beta-helix repeat-containing protein [Tabrizicola rongguiensis]MCF1711102.1 right-handed parallel beta-helix repeat-containing protein [Tabrizicola rongguiensis]